MAEPVTLRQALNAGRDRLRDAQIDDADLEAEVLLRYALGLGTDRAALFQRLSDNLDAPASQRFESFLTARTEGNPTAYITGLREFYGHAFAVTPAVLIPRPETELLVEAAIELANALRSTKMAGSPLTLIDVGTGSGAIAISLALALPGAVIYATDVSPAALGVAAGNARRHGVECRIRLVQADLLSAAEGALPRADVIVANLPYVPSAVIATLEREVRDHEPRLALDGGADGLDLIRRLVAQAPAYLNDGGALCLEIGADQGETALAIASDALFGASITVRRDLAERVRLLVAQYVPRS